MTEMADVLLTGLCVVGDKPIAVVASVRLDRKVEVDVDLVEVEVVDDVEADVEEVEVEEEVD